VPRQIIDTESSKPQYVRRIVVRTVLVVIIVAILVIVAIAAWGLHGHRAARATGMLPTLRVSWQPSITPRPYLPGTPKENPCCVA
jgi:hypothetical protein